RPCSTISDRKPPSFASRSRRPRPRRAKRAPSAGEGMLRRLAPGILVLCFVPGVASETAPELPRAPGRIWYVRQTVGDDSHDGTAPGKAWRSLSRLARALRAGDTAYVGPGLYREQLN